MIFAQNHGLQLYGEEEERNTRMNVRVTDARRLVISLKTVVSQDLRSLDSPAGLTSLPLLNFETIFVKRALINDRIILCSNIQKQGTVDIFHFASHLIFVSYFILALIIEREIFEDSGRKLISRLYLTNKNLFDILNYSYFYCECFYHTFLYILSKFHEDRREHHPVIPYSRMNDKRVFRFKSHKGATISIHEKSERKSGRKKRRQKELDDFMVAARKTVGKNLSTDPSPEKNDTEEG